MTCADDGAKAQPVDVVRWKRAQELFHAARELRITDRERFLEFHCKDDDAMRSVVESLLRAAAGSAFLDDAFQEGDERLDRRASPPETT